jgi:hypothetical protein
MKNGKKGLRKTEKMEIRSSFPKPAEANHMGRPKSPRTSASAR